MQSLFASLFLATSVMLPANQQKPPSHAPLETPAPLALTGCVSGRPGASGDFTFLDSTSGGKYRLTGKSVRKYAGHRVEIVGGSGTKRLSVRGGLLPSPNVAAQAGALDPAQAAIASQPGGPSTGTAEA